MAVEVLKKIWPEWEIEGKPLGKGSFGVVYKAVRRDHGVESYAAIKVISIPSDSSEVDSLRSEGLDMNATRTYLQGIVDDFVSEIQLMESLKGVQNIVSVEDYKVVEKTDEIGWDIYIRMELLTTFNTYICDKKLSEQEVIKLGCDICTALEICAQRDIIHRDIKPENIFINDFGYFKLGDFGIARKMENMTGGLSQKGTFNYMAPEVATSSKYDARVDMYSLGIVLYRLLNGNRLPFLDTEKQLLNPTERRNAVERRIQGEELPAPCDASPAMADLILRACAYNPDMRFASATEMKEALMSVAEGTYEMTASNLDRTTSVRKAPIASIQKLKPVVNFFGSVSKDKKKMRAVIAAALAVLLLFVGIFTLPRLFDGNDNKNPGETTQYSKQDEEQISAIISEAELLAAKDDYEGALAKIQTALVTYPKSEALQNKSAEYKAVLDAQNKTSILEEAATLAESGDYVAAMALIKNAQDTYGNDADYQKAYDTYSQAHKAAVKTEALEKANGFAEQKDYLNAYKTVKQAITSVGEDVELTAKAAEYEEAYITDIIFQADALLTENDLSATKTLLQSALKEFPNNETIKSRLEEIDKYKTVPLDSLKAINGGFSWNTGAPADPFDSDYSTVKNYTIYHGDNSFRPCEDYDTTYAEYKIDQKYDILQLNVSPYSDCGTSAYSYIQIYADGVLRYVSPAIGRKSGITNVKVDVSGASYLKIQIIKRSHGCLMLSDVTLTSIPNYVSSYEGGTTSLATLNPINGGVEWDSGFPTNMKGDSYVDTANYTIYHGDNSFRPCEDYDTTYAEYYLEGKYSSLSLDMAPYSDFGQNAKTVVKVYVDDVLVYTGTITQRSDKMSTGDIDLTNAQYLRIVIEKDNYGCVILSDVMLKNAS